MTVVLEVVNLKMHLIYDISLKEEMVVLFPGEDIYAEESFFLSTVCRNSNPLPVPCTLGGFGPSNQMVCFISQRTTCATAFQSQDATAHLST